MEWSENKKMKSYKEKYAYQTNQVSKITVVNLRERRSHISYYIPAFYTSFYQRFSLENFGLI